ncbi:MAG: glycosyltransferase family 4 protein [Desulfovibrio sp.]|jgi:glycosyltransferase involved in cell wall biosynthesis|nr:glycosyltransferase family 4 protein [Desulfovibrio sp.]
MTPIRVLAFYDHKGWAWWHRLHNVQRHLPTDISMDMREVYDDFAYEQYDFFLVLESYLLPLLRHIPAEKIIAGSSCARIADKACSAQADGHCLALIFNSREMFVATAPGQRTYCCQNGVDTDLFTPALQPPETFTACWIGNGSSICEKGLEIIQKACRRESVPLLFRDQSRERAPLTQREVRDRYYRKASVYLCASRWEGTPNPALESLACGLPVISTPVGNMPEIIEDGKNGLLTERTVESFASALARLRDMDQTALRANARQCVLDGWTWAQQAQKYANMFRELAAFRKLSPTRFEKAGKETYREYLLRLGAAALREGRLKKSASRLAWFFRYTPLWRAMRHVKHKYLVAFFTIFVGT